MFSPELQWVHRENTEDLLHYRHKDLKLESSCIFLFLESEVTEKLADREEKTSEDEEHNKPECHGGSSIRSWYSPEAPRSSQKVWRTSPGLVHKWYYGTSQRGWCSGRSHRKRVQSSLEQPTHESIHTAQLLFAFRNGHGIDKSQAVYTRE